MKIIQKFLPALIGLFFFVFSPIGWAAFPDVAEDHPYYRAIATLQYQGVVEGEEGDDSQRYYYPDKTINRAAYVTIALRGAGIEIPEVPEGEMVFDDVMGGVWYAGPIKAAKELGIIHGDDGTNTFRPGDPVTLTEALKVALLADSRKMRNKVEEEFWYQPYLDYAAYYRLPETNTLPPGENVSRGFMANLMYELNRRQENHEIKENYQEGEASFYGGRFEGSGTANGETFTLNEFTAAHTTLPFDTWIKVTDKDTGNITFARINDRGPYTEGRIVDLSRTAFQTIAPLSRGIANVSIETFPEPPPDLSPIPKIPPTEKKDPTVCADLPVVQKITAHSFDNITLDEDLSNIYAENQIFHLSGQVAGDQTVVTAFLIDENNNQHVDQARIIDGRFEMFTNFPHSGMFKLGLLPGNGGSSKAKEIHVLPTDCLTEENSTEVAAPSEIQLSVKEGKTKLSWQNSGNQENLISKLTFRQGEHEISLITQSKNDILLPLRAFQLFTEGEVKLTIQNATLTEENIFHAKTISWGQPTTLSFQATLHRVHEYHRNKVELLELTSNTNQDFLQLSFDPKESIQAEAAIILPNGTVERVLLSSPTHNSITDASGHEVFPAASHEVNLSYLTSQEGVYVIEANDTSGLAVLNIAIYPEDTLPLLPNPADLSNRAPVDLGSDLNALNQQMLELVNQERHRQGKGVLIWDAALTELAQARATDMTTNNYFSHSDLSGKTIKEIKKDYGIEEAVSENLAKETTIELAMFGLSSSAIHLENMLLPQWMRAGFGFSKNSDGSYTMVQVFSVESIQSENLPALKNTILEAINKNRNQSLELSETLNVPAQSWSDNMAENEFFNFVSPSGEELKTLIEGINSDKAMASYLVGNASFSEALEKISENDQFLESRWREIGLGIAQDILGVKITVILSE